MKVNDFQQLVDREFASLTWTDRQRLDTLHQMIKEARPIMKRKLITAIIAAILLLTLTGTAVAAGLNITSLKEFFERSAAFLGAYGYTTPQFVESSVAHPKSYRHTSDLVDVTVDQMYLTDDTFYFTVHFNAKDPNTLLFDTYHNSITLNGEEKRFYQLWDHEELMLLQVGSMTLDDLNGTDPLVYFHSIDAIRDPQTGAVTFMYAFRYQDSSISMRSHNGGTMMLRFQVHNLRSNEVEWNVLFLDFPEMEIENADPDNTD